MMTGSIWIPLGALASIAALVWFSYALGFRGRRTLSGDDELMALTRAYGGARDFVVDANRASAIAMLHDGRVFLCKVVGNAIVTRVYSKDEIASVADYRSTRDHVRGIAFQFKDLGFPSLKLEVSGEVLPQWFEDLKRK